jgi:hypothetical protein
LALYKQTNTSKESDFPVTYGMAEPKIPPDLEVDVNENCERKIDPILGGIDK